MTIKTTRKHEEFFRKHEALEIASIALGLFLIRPLSITDETFYLTRAIGFAGSWLENDLRND